MSYILMRRTQMLFVSWFFLLLLVVGTNIVYADVSLLGLQAVSTSDSIAIAWSNSIPAENVYATVTLAGQTRTCEQDKNCQVEFSELSPGTTYAYKLKLVDTGNNAQILESANVQTLPLLAINNIKTNPSQTSVDFNWHNEFSAIDLAAITSSVTINGLSIQCNAAADCNATISNLQPNLSYLYTVSTLDPLANINYSTSGVVTTLAYPALQISLQDKDERCSALECTDVIDYAVTGGMAPYTVHLKSASPAVIAEQQFSNSTWVVQLQRNTAYVLEFTATDIHGGAGAAEIKINSGG